MTRSVDSAPGMAIRCTRLRALYEPCTCTRLSVQTAGHVFDLPMQDIYLTGGVTSFPGY